MSTPSTIWVPSEPWVTAEPWNATTPASRTPTGRTLIIHPETRTVKVER